MAKSRRSKQKAKEQAQKKSSKQYVKSLVKTGIKALKGGEFEKAEIKLKKALELDDQNFDAYLHLAMMALLLNKHESAVFSAIAATEIKPDSAKALYVLGNAYNKIKAYDLAVKEFIKSLNIEPKKETFNDMGAAFQKLNETDKAITAFNYALKEDPDFFDARVNRAVCFISQGKNKEAESELKKCIEMDSSYIPAIRALVYLRTFSPDEVDELVDFIADSITGTYQTKPNLARAYYTMAKLYDDKGEYETAMENYIRGGAIMTEFNEEENGFNLESFMDSVNRSKAAFPEPSKPENNTDETPLFIIGMPRTGTTLIDQVLLSHSLVHSEGELNNWPEFISNLKKDIQTQGNDPGTFPEMMQFLNEESLKDFAENYIDLLHERFPGMKYVIDKTPNNYLYVGLIKMMFPKAKFIHSLRHPIATVVSNLKMIFAEDDTWQYTYDLDNLATYYKEIYLPLMDYWKELYPGDIIDIHYEDMVLDFDNQVQRLMEFLDLEYEPALQEFYKTDRAVWTASHSQVRKPLYKGSIDQWKRYDKFLDKPKEILGIID